jgi:uncharacterized protein
MRGLITIEVLAELEQQLRQALVGKGKLAEGDKFVLADYFDYIAGTSTGAIIATALSLGMSVAEVRQFYEDSGKQMFKAAKFWEKLFYKFRATALEKQLKDVFGEKTTLGGDKLNTLLMLVMRNVTTDSPWTLSNNPNAKYNEADRDDCNLRLPLWKLVRASTAAPTFFPAERVTIGKREFVFVDGGITPYNNPAFQLFLMATAAPYKLMWPTGEDKMLLISVGTGLTPKPQANLSTKKMHLLFQAQTLPPALMFATQNEQDLLCRVFGNCLAGDVIEREVWDLIANNPDAAGNIQDTTGPANPKLFTYARYDAELSQEVLQKLGVGHLDAARVEKMDSVDYMPQLQEVGRAIAKRVNVAAPGFAAFL